MITKSYHIDLDQLAIKSSSIALAMRFDPDNPVGPYAELIEEVLDEVKPYCNIQGGYTIVQDPIFNKFNMSINIGSEQLFPEKIVHGFLRKSEALAIFTCTAGGVGEWSKELMAEGDLLKGYVVDVVGNEIVERAMDSIESYLSDQIRGEGLNITTRYSPGYCNWSVAEQHKIFSFFPEGFCGVQLTPSGLMKPMKSISGIIGIGSDVKAMGYSCSACEDEMCIYRNVKDREEAKIGH